MPKSGFCDQRKTAALVMAVASEKAHPLALTQDNQAIAIVLDFMDPVGAAWNLSTRVGKQGSKAVLRICLQCRFARNNFSQLNPTLQSG